jgi:hypothetical protein
MRMTLQFYSIIIQTNKTTVMLNTFTNGKLNTKMHFQLFKMLMLAFNVSGLFIYGFLHFIFFDFPFESFNEAVILLKLFAVASCFASGISLLLFAVDLVEYAIQKRQQLRLSFHIKTIAVGMIILILILSACNGQLAVSKGIKKDLTTGLTASYSNMEPGNVMLVMNDEIINHTDIPLGASFLLVNDKVKGMKVKEGKVSVGCALKITDQKGNILLQEKDLFKGHDVFNEKDASYLKCTVSTGKPMQWEEKYDVAVTFWDKFGNGKIENKVTIKSIDIP